MPRFDQNETRRLNFIWASHKGYRHASFWPISCWFPRCISWTVDQKWSIQYSHTHDASVPSINSLYHYANHTLPLYGHNDGVGMVTYLFSIGGPLPKWLLAARVGPGWGHEPGISSWFPTRQKEPRHLGNLLLCSQVQEQELEREAELWGLKSELQYGVASTVSNDEPAVLQWWPFLSAL